MLADVRSKIGSVQELLSWLRDNKCALLDLEAMRQEQPDLFEPSFPMIVLYGSENAALPDLSVEEISGVDELDNTDLTNTPIVYHVCDVTEDGLNRDVNWLLGRKDVSLKQLFFVIHPSLDDVRIRRTLVDLGVPFPQVIEDASAVEVTRYIEDYPMTEYVRYAALYFDAHVARMSGELAEKNRRGELSCAEERAKIAVLDDEISRLRRAEDALAHLDALERPLDIASAKEELEKALLGWKSRKTKITGADEIKTWARSFGVFAEQAYGNYQVRIRTAMDDACCRADSDLRSYYKKAGIDPAYKPSPVSIASHRAASIPDIEKEALKLVSATYEEPKKDFFGLFAAPDSDETEYVMVISSYLDRWRERAAELILPIAEGEAQELMEELSTDCKRAAESYIARLNQLVHERRQEKEQLASRLSGDERALQAENDWLSEFKDRLYAIERG